MILANGDWCGVESNGETLVIFEKKLKPLPRMISEDYAKSTPFITGHVAKLEKKRSRVELGHLPTPNGPETASKRFSWIRR